MPEGRMLKKVVSESKSLGNLPNDSSRLLYTWLIPFLDVEGRHSADPEIIKGHIFPKVRAMTIGKIARLLGDLADGGLITLYRGNGEMCLQFNKFREHQKLNTDREAESKMPAPDKENIINSCELMTRSGELIVKINKVKLNKVQVKADNTGQLFEEFWQAYPREGRFHKKACLTRFMSIAKNGGIDDLKAGFAGYVDHLKDEKLNKHFDKQPMHMMTFMNKERYLTYKGFRYEPSL